MAEDMVEDSCSSPVSYKAGTKDKVLLDHTHSDLLP